MQFYSYQSIQLRLALEDSISRLKQLKQINLSVRYVIYLTCPYTWWSFRIREPARFDGRSAVHIGLFTAYSRILSANCSWKKILKTIPSRLLFHRVCIGVIILRVSFQGSTLQSNGWIRSLAVSTPHIKKLGRVLGKFVKILEGSWEIHKRVQSNNSTDTSSYHKGRCYTPNHSPKTASSEGWSIFKVA
jgi:hypothetical protein